MVHVRESAVRTVRAMLAQRRCALAIAYVLCPTLGYLAYVLNLYALADRLMRRPLPRYITPAQAVKLHEAGFDPEYWQFDTAWAYSDTYTQPPIQPYFFVPVTQHPPLPTIPRQPAQWEPRYDGPPIDTTEPTAMERQFLTQYMDVAPQLEDIAWPSNSKTPEPVAPASPNDNEDRVAQTKGKKRARV